MELFLAALIENINMKSMFFVAASLLLSLSLSLFDATCWHVPLTHVEPRLQTRTVLIEDSSIATDSCRVYQHFIVSILYRYLYTCMSDLNPSYLDERVWSCSVQFAFPPLTPQWAWWLQCFPGRDWRRCICAGPARCDWCGIPLLATRGMGHGGCVVPPTIPWTHSFKPFIFT